MAQYGSSKMSVMNLPPVNRPLSIRTNDLQASKVIPHHTITDPPP